MWITIQILVKETKAPVEKYLQWIEFAMAIQTSDLTVSRTSGDTLVKEVDKKYSSLSPRFRTRSTNIDEWFKTSQPFWKINNVHEI